MTKDNYKTKVSKLINFFTDAIFPKFCLGCNKEGQYLCVECQNKIDLNVWSACYKCDKRTHYNYVCDDCRKKTALSGLLVAGNWENELLRQLIYEYKYRFVAELKKELSQTLINYLEKNYEASRADVRGIFSLLLRRERNPSEAEISSYSSTGLRPRFSAKGDKTLINNNAIVSFVPLHKRRIIWRGFNQAELLAKEVSEHFDLPMVNLLERSRNTPPQAEIKKREKRQENIKKSFIVSPIPPALIQDKIVLLIDDVCTTGATLEECAKIIKPLKPKEIWGLVLARG